MSRLEDVSLFLGLDLKMHYVFIEILFLEKFLSSWCLTQCVVIISIPRILIS